MKNITKRKIQSFVLAIIAFVEVIFSWIIIYPWLTVRCGSAMAAVITFVADLWICTVFNTIVEGLGNDDENTADNGNK
jgi:hypothetical protein